jgi:hypothetical protein
VAPPNLSVVDGAVGDASNQSVRVEWRFVDEGANRWIRLTTAGTPNIPNPIVDLTQPITLRVLLQPVVGCNNPYADTEPDGDVDGDDFGKLQACLTADAAGILPGCACFNRDGDDDVDSDDIGPFDACASGPDVPANPTCDD